MGKISEFNIVLHGNRLVYYPGEQLYGEVILNLNKPMDMRGLRIECQGKAHCRWSEKRGTGDNRRTVHYHSSEDYFEYKVCLFGNLPQDGNTTMSHPTGRFIYPFRFTLPYGLPSSFESFHGSIRYELKAQIDKPWKFDHKVKLPFTVNEVIDINQQEYSIPVSDHAHKEVGCLCCKAGPLDLNASTDRKGYCPGEAILVNVEVNNHTTKDMAGMKVRLYQRISYIASTKTKHTHKQVSELLGPAIPKGETATWNNQPFGIPGTAPTILSSKVVNVEYYLQAEVDVPMGLDLKAKLPIILGTVPFRATYGQQYDFSSQPFMGENAYISAPPPPPSLLGHPDMAPPSYAATFGEKDIHIGDSDDKHTFGNLNYMPVYTFAQPYQGNLPPPTTGVAPPNYPAVDNQPSVYPPQGVYPPPNINPPPGVNPPPGATAGVASPNYPAVDNQLNAYLPQGVYPPASINPPPGAYPPPDATTGVASPNDIPQVD